MTLVNVKNLLLTHFLSNDTFALKGEKSDLPLIEIAGEENEEIVPHKEEVVKLALKELESVGFVKLVDEPTQLYILSQPINSFLQQVTISPACAEMLADTITTFAKGSEMPGVNCNKLNIVESDIMNLIHMFHMLLDESEDFGPDAQSSDGRGQS